MDCWVAVGEGSDSVFREPSSLPCDFEGGGKNGSVFVFRAHASEVFWCEATMDVLAEMFRCEVVCFDLVCVVYSFVYECFVVIYLHYVYRGWVRGFGCGKGIRYACGWAFVSGRVKNSSFH